MESWLKLLPRNCYNTYSSVVLALFVAFGVLLINTANNYESKSSLECDIGEYLANTRRQGKFIETTCVQKYDTQDILPSLPLDVLGKMNFGLVVVLSVVYGYLVKHRVDIFSNNENIIAPAAYQGSNRYFVFRAYVVHLIICRIIPLTMFAAYFFSCNFPTHFQCPLPNTETRTSTSHEGVARPTANSFCLAKSVTRTTKNTIFVDCIYSMGEKKEQVVAGFFIINLLADAVTLMELVYLLWSAWKRPTFHTDQEFISVYLLRKRTETIPEINQEIRQKIRENQSQNLFYVKDDFGGEYVSRRALDEIFINVTIQDGREPVDYFKREFMKGRHEIYDIQLKKPPDAKVLESTVELFQAAKAGEEPPRTVLVVGRPGIGKTLLTKKMFNESQQVETSHLWHERILVLIQFRSLSKCETSLQEILSQAYGLDMSSPHCDMTIYEYICKNPSNVVLVFDGFDELKFDEECLTDEKIVNGPDEICHTVIFRELF